MANIAPMLGAILGVANAQKKSKPAKAAKAKHVAEPTHAILMPSTNVEPKPLSDRKLIKENAKHTLRRATDDWVEGRISTKEHKAVHERTKHVLSGKEPREFKGQSGERSFKKMGMR